MVNDTEIPKPAIEGQKPEQDRLSQYKDVLYKEATSLLAQYLPEALPQEPTEISFAILARYQGKFRGTHYLTTSSKATEDLIFREGRIEMKEAIRKARKERNSKEFRIKDAEFFNEQLRELKEEGYDIPDDNFMKIEDIEDLDEPEETSEEDKEEDNWDKLIGSLDTRQGYSAETWTAVQNLIHELIHQKQEELNPSAAPELSSPELDQISDTKKVPSSKLRQLAGEASFTQSSARPEGEKTSLCFVAMEGMAVAGSYYVMGKFADDLAKSGDINTAVGIREARDNQFHDAIGRIRRNELNGNTASALLRNSPYDLNYVRGIEMVRKLYKQFGIENATRLLTQVNLQACLKITKDSPQYKQILNNPALLPGLPQAA